MERAPIEEERALMEKEAPQAKYEESRPSVAQPDKGKEVSRRARFLGY